MRIVALPLSLLLFGSTLLLVVLYGRDLRAAADARTHGELRYGPFQKALGWYGAALAGVVSVIEAFQRDQFGWFAVLFISLVAMTIYALGEAYGTTGRFDDETIEIRTPWSGIRRESWDDLVDVTFNDMMWWYVLTFRTGTRFRIPILLHGHGELIELLQAFEEELSDGAGDNDSTPDEK